MTSINRGLSIQSKCRQYSSKIPSLLGDLAVVQLLLSTSVMKLYAIEESFTFMKPPGHVFAGWITFSAHEADIPPFVFGFPSCSVLRNHSETCASCIISWTTAPPAHSIGKDRPRCGACY